MDVAAVDLHEGFEQCVSLEPAPDGLRARNMPLGDYHRLFGGQLLAQALAAASDPGPATGPDPGRTARSIHMLFCAEGRPGQEVSWSVEAVHDGRTFATRSVTGRQGERLLVSALVALHVPGEGFEHHDAPPPVPPPEDLDPIGPIGALPVEMRVAGGVDLDCEQVGPPELMVWMRAVRSFASDTPERHQQLLAYCSDGTMLGAALRPHAGVGLNGNGIGAAAITAHTVSFHRPFRIDDWLLFAQRSPVASAGRAYIRGDWFDRSGALVASCAQEAYVRLAS